MGRLYSRFQEIADRRGRCLAVLTADENIAFETLSLAVDRTASALAARGVGAGKLLQARFAKPEFYLITLLAANKIGASLLFGTEADAGQIDRRIDHQVSDQAPEAGLSLGTIVLERALWTGDARHGDVNNVIDSDGIQLIFGTSGSTGERKFLAISERNLLKRIAVKSRFIAEDTRMLCTMGPATLVANETHLAAILGGGSTVMLPLKSDYIAHYVDLFHVTALFSTPLIYGDLLELDFTPRLYRTLERVIFGGSIAPANVVAGIAEKVCGNIVLAYGSSEMGTISWLTYEPGRYATGMAGRILDDVVVEILGEDGAPLPAGVEGIIRIRRDNVIAEERYINSAAVQDEAFSDGWFYPGDSGSVDNEGNLTIAGRDDDVINVGGNKFSLDLIENEIEANFDCRCAALRDQGANRDTHVVLVLNADRDMRSRRIRKMVDKRFPRLEISGIYQTVAIAQTDSGKKDRIAVSRLLASEPGLFRRLE